MLDMLPTEINERLQATRIGRLSMAQADGRPYIIPLPFCWHDGALYLRLPMTGRKGRILATNPNVCFEIDWYTDTLDDYGSVLIEGTLKSVESLNEKAAVKSANDEKYNRLRQGVRPGHGRHTPLEQLSLQKIVVAQLSGRTRERPLVAAGSARQALRA